MIAQSLFKTHEGAAQYMAAYNAVLALWPVPHQTLDVQTRFGTTHINSAGSQDLPPLLLIHGFGVCSTQWYPNVAPLSRHFQVFAPDVPGQMGLSVASQRLRNRQDCANWLIDLLEALNL